MLHTVIIGAGFSGIAAAYKLRQAGYSEFLILEAADQVGGTWRDNVYPGCACDVPSLLYSFSFDQKYDWSFRYSRQGEIHEYLKGAIERLKLKSHLRLGTKVLDARWDDQRALWVLTLEGDNTLEAQHVISATGPLRIPKIPDIEGLSNFPGPVMHSARWDHSVSLTGKRVGVVGTGASAIQFIPEIVSDVSHLAVFQRTPSWIVARDNKPWRTLRRYIFAHFPFVQRLWRRALYWRMEAVAYGFVRNLKWAKGFQKRAEAQLRRQVRDPDLRATLTPDYTIGCKRTLVSDDYYPAISQPHVELFGEALVKVEGNTLTGAGGSRSDVDVIILGTGFDTDNPLRDVPLYGRGGRHLQSEWETKSADAYLGTMIAGYPNFFMMTGPNTGIGHTSVIHMSEAQADMIVRLLNFAKDRDSRCIDVDPAVQDIFNTQLTAREAGTIWHTGCDSWYLDRFGRNVIIWPDFTYKFHNACRTVPAGAFVFAAK